MTGMVERVARTDSLSTALWSAMTTQHMRRGEDWLLKKVVWRPSVPNSLLKHLKRHLQARDYRTCSQVDGCKDQMLLLNLLGGRLPLGHRLVGMDVGMLKQNRWMTLIE